MLGVLEYGMAATRLGFRAHYTGKHGINVVGSNSRHISRLVIKDRAGQWFATRMWIYQNAFLGRLYGRMRGH